MPIRDLKQPVSLTLIAMEYWTSSVVDTGTKARDGNSTSSVRSRNKMPGISLQIRPREQVQVREFGSLRTVEWQNREYRFSLVGELPKGLMRTIASTVP